MFNKFLIFGLVAFLMFAIISIVAISSFRRKTKNIFRSIKDGNKNDSNAGDIIGSLNGIDIFPNSLTDMLNTSMKKLFDAGEGVDNTIQTEEAKTKYCQYCGSVNVGNECKSCGAKLSK